MRGDASWARDTLDSRTSPTRGIVQSAYGEMGLPGGTLHYYKINYQHQRYHPLARDYTLRLNGEIGIANGLANDPLPFFKNYYAGGISSVRGFKSGTLGPKDSNGEAIGGGRRLVGNEEIYFPMPGLGQDKSIRLSAFMDIGTIVAANDSFSTSDVRYSTGLGVNWVSPVGPLRFSLAKPLNSKSGDKTEVFQFQLGSVF